jgi:hypothetical protein
MPPEKRTLVLTHFPRFLSDLEEEIYSAGHSYSPVPAKNWQWQAFLQTMLRIRIRCLFDPWIRIRDEQPGSYFRELRNHLFGLKYLNSLMRIRDGKNSDPGWTNFGSGINIPDPQHCLQNLSSLVWVGTSLQ